MAISRTASPATGVAEDKNISVDQLDLADALREAGILAKGFNMDFITGADASESRPEQAGIGVAMLGSFFMMLVVLAVACRSASRPRSISRSSPPRTASPISSR